MDLSDVHQAFGEHVIANMESNHPPEEHDVVRDPDGPNEAAFEILGRLPDSRTCTASAGALVRPASSNSLTDAA